MAAAFEAILARAAALAPGVEQGQTYGMPGLVYRGRPLLSVRQTREHLGYYPFSAAVVESVAGVIDRMILARRNEIDAAAANPR